MTDEIDMHLTLTPFSISFSTTENRNSRFHLSLIAKCYRDKRDDERYDDSKIIVVAHRPYGAAAPYVLFVSLS